MRKVALAPMLMILACLFAGAYGALHNQISYTVAPEYFTQFKFHQFRLDPNLPPRLGAGIVGFLAAWWMGLLIGCVLIPLGWLIHGTANYFWGMLRVFAVVTVTTLCVGLLALLVAFLTLTPENAGEFSRYGNEIVDDVAFARAGTMHNFSYLGGLVGLLSGIGAVWRERRRAMPSESNSVGS